MKRKEKTKRNIVLTVLGGLLIVALLASGIGSSSAMVEKKRDSFLSLKSSIQENMRTNHHYRCCLEKPCIYCIEKTPGHGEGAACDCLGDLVQGKHPCGECIGEILEGHGNPLLAEYFAEALAEEVGFEYKEMLQKIIEDKYGLPIEEQI